MSKTHRKSCFRIATLSRFYHSSADTPLLERARSNLPLSLHLFRHLRHTASKQPYLSQHLYYWFTVFTRSAPTPLSFPNPQGLICSTPFLLHHDIFITLRFFCLSRFKHTLFISISIQVIFCFDLCVSPIPDLFI